MSDSRIEALLEALLNGTEPPGELYSRIEAYLYALCKKNIQSSEGSYDKDGIVNAVLEALPTWQGGAY